MIFIVAVKTLDFQLREINEKIGDPEGRLNLFYDRDLWKCLNKFQQNSMIQRDLIKRIFEQGLDANSYTRTEKPGGDYLISFEIQLYKMASSNKSPSPKYER